MIGVFLPSLDVAKYFFRIRYISGYRAGSAEGITLALPPPTSKAFSSLAPATLPLPAASKAATSVMTLDGRGLHPLLPFALKGLIILCLVGGPGPKRDPQPRLGSLEGTSGCLFPRICCETFLYLVTREINETRSSEITSIVVLVSVGSSHPYLDLS